MKNETKPLLISLVLISVLIVGIGVVAGNDDLLGVYELGDKEFEKVEIGDMIVYWQQRMIDDAIVEGDYIVYQFDKNTHELLKIKEHWRSDLPDHVIPVITKEQAEYMVKGEVQFTQLYIISPESDVFPLDPTPQNPCWVVRSVDNGGMIVTIIDAVEGEILGYGVPPPYTAFSLGGPDHGLCDEYYYDPYALNAGNWFNTMGYSTEIADRPTEGTVQSHIQSTQTALFYELAHGDSYGFLNKNCPTEHITSAEVETWITGYTKMPFTFLGSCGGMCDTGDNAFSYEFRKGSTSNTVTVGYCHMDWGPGDPYDCTGAWSNALNWQNNLFDYMEDGDTVKDAFDDALADYPMCVNCMQFAGDENFAVVPVVTRGALPVADAGPDQTLEQAYYQGASATLDGSGSYDPDGGTLTYSWTWNGESATGVNPTVSLPLGTTTISLTVNDGEDSAPDTVDITVVDTTPPSVDAGSDITVEQATAAGTEVTLSATVSDICDASPTIIWSHGPTAVFPLGSTTVTVTATDASSNSASDTVVVNVVDTTPPDLTVPADVTVEQESAAGTVVPLTATATDICDADVDITSDELAIYPLGDTTVAFTATDDSGNSISKSMVVHVIDTTPPDISVAVSPDTLWPSNHKMVDITATVLVRDICDADPTVVLTSVTSDEPDDAIGNGDGKTVNDIQADIGTTDYEFKLRAERAGEGDGRVYTIVYTATDASGNSASASATVVVPHDKR